MREAIQQIRARADRMREQGLSTQGEHAGATWAIDALEQLLAPAPCRFSDDIHELTLGSARGG